MSAESESEKRYMKDPKAKSLEGFIEGMNILSKYMEEGISTKYFLGAEHDVMYIYTMDEEPEEDSPDGLRLSELGFHFSNEIDSWAYFT